MKKMTNDEFCEKVTRMLGQSLKLVEIERDYFEVKSNKLWVSDDHSIYLSEGFKEWVKPFAWREFRKHVQWDNLGLRFWFVDDLKGS